MGINMFKLLQINTTSNWGSTGRIATEIGNLVINRGGQSFIAYGRYSNHSESYEIKLSSKLSIYLHGIYTRIFDKHGLFSKRDTINLISEIKRINPDIIHLHNIHGYYLNYLLLFNFLSKTNIPIVWTLHDCWSFTGHCAYFSFINCDRWKTGCHHCPQKKSYPASILFDRSKNNYRDKKNAFTSVKNMTIIPVSNWLANEVKQSFLKKYPIKVIHNGIDLEVFKPHEAKKKLDIKGKYVVLGVASGWEERKGLKDFIKLRSLLSSEFSIVLIGLKKKQIESLPEEIIGIPRTNSVKELAEYYSMANVYFNPTWEDNFPTTNLEALACGTPVITYRTGGSIEAVDDKTGFIVEQGDLNMATNIIQTICKEGKEKYKDACRQRAVRLYNKNDRYEEYIQLYNSLLR